MSSPSQLTRRQVLMAASLVAGASSVQADRKWVFVEPEVATPTGSDMVSCRLTGLDFGVENDEVVRLDCPGEFVQPSRLTVNSDLELALLAVYFKYLTEPEDDAHIRVDLIARDDRRRVLADVSALTSDPRLANEPRLKSGGRTSVRMIACRVPISLSPPGLVTRIESIDLVFTLL